jgi:hypothetical protein
VERIDSSLSIPLDHEALGGISMTHFLFLNPIPMEFPGFFLRPRTSPSTKPDD